MAQYPNPIMIMSAAAIIATPVVMIGRFFCAGGVSELAGVDGDSIYLIYHVTPQHYPLYVAKKGHVGEGIAIHADRVIVVKQCKRIYDIFAMSDTWN